MPASFLIDQQGRLAVIYKGPVSVDLLLEDAARSAGDRLERFVRSAPFAGRPIRHPQVERMADHSAVYSRFLFADHLQRSGREDQAAMQYADVLKFSPDSFKAHYNLANALLGQGELETAVGHYREALRIRPESAKTYTNLGVAMKRQGELGDAIEHFHRALQIAPEDGMAHYNLGNALQGQGKVGEAIEHFRRALRAAPDDAKMHTSLGVALNIRGEFADATGRFLDALRIDPDDTLAHTNLGVALGAQGDDPGAVQQYSRALELNPDVPMALNNLARIRASHPDTELRDGAQAVELAERCCQLTGYRVASALGTLAAAYAEVSRFDDAIKWQSKAIEHARPRDKQAQSLRLDLYKQGKPFRDRK